jgi:hypothetical protein
VPSWQWTVVVWVGCSAAGDAAAVTDYMSSLLLLLLLRLLLRLQAMQ